jgi:hypothetical protein
MGRGINSGSIQIQPGNALKKTKSRRVDPKRGINKNLFATGAKLNGSSAFYAAKAHCTRGAMPMMAEPEALVDGREERTKHSIYKE